MRLQWCCYRSQNGNRGLDIFAVTGVGHRETGDDPPYPGGCKS